MKTPTRSLKYWTNRTPCQVALLIPLALACFALSPTAQAVCQQGCDTPAGSTFLGDDALVNGTTAYGNTAIGDHALTSDTTGTYNTASGVDTLFYNTTGFSNTATGSWALFENTSGGWNTATGLQALNHNSSGNANTAIGITALFYNTIGSNNTAIGGSTLYANTTGHNNTAICNLALANNTTGSFNTATGDRALYANTTGDRNTANGANALFHNTIGNSNIGLGNAAGSNLTTGGNNIDIGNAGVAGESNTIRIGGIGNQTNTFIAGISGAAVAGGVGVIIDSTGHMGTIVSSERFKDSIKPMDKASEAILGLRPVTFCYKHDLDPVGVPQFGLVAEDVQKVDPDLVARDEEGKPYTVRYDAVNAMLLNEFLKEHQTVQELKKQVAELTAGLQKVSAQLELNKHAPETVSNNH